MDICYFTEKALIRTEVSLPVTVCLIPPSNKLQVLVRTFTVFTSMKVPTRRLDSYHSHPSAGEGSSHSSLLNEKGRDKTQLEVKKSRGKKKSRYKKVEIKKVG